MTHDTEKMAVNSEDSPKILLWDLRQITYSLEAHFSLHKNGANMHFWVAIGD